MPAETKRWIILTGVTRGLGRAMAAEFIRRGHTVCGCGRDSAAVAKLRAEFGAPHDFAMVDVASDTAVRAWAGSPLPAEAFPANPRRARSDAPYHACRGAGYYPALPTHHQFVIADARRPSHRPEHLLSPSLSSIRNGGEGARRAGEEALGIKARNLIWKNSSPRSAGLQPGASPIPRTFAPDRRSALRRFGADRFLFGAGLRPLGRNQPPHGAILCRLGPAQFPLGAVRSLPGATRRLPGADRWLLGANHWLRLRNRWLRLHFGSIPGDVHRSKNITNKEIHYGRLHSRR